jgi:hypothetical protein
MASNNYAEVVTDTNAAQPIIDKFESMATQNCTFKVLQFNPQVDRFAISCLRESNFPTLPDVEEGGATMDGAAVSAVWNANADTVQAVNFGNGHSGLYYESGGRGYMVITTETRQ